MGKCKFCGQPAGFLRRRHPECRNKYDLAKNKLPEFFVQWMHSEVPVDRFRDLAQRVAEDSYLTEQEFRSLAVTGISKLVEKVLDDHVLTEHEEQKVAVLQSEFQIKTNDLKEIGVKLIKCAILRDLDLGKAPKRLKLEGPMPLNFAREEVLIWVFQDVTYLTTKSRTHYVGGSHGVSVRLMKGLYYRVGDYRGEPIKTQYLSEEGNGFLAITDRAIYFWSPEKTLKIAPKKIVSIDPFSDGIQITRDAATAKPQIFKLDDPWFASNIIAKLNQLD